MGNKKITKLFNNTREIMVIWEFRGLLRDENDFIRKITVEAGQQTDIDSAKFVGAESQGGQPSNLKIFCNGSFLRSSGGDLVLRGNEFINFKTVTIDPVDQNSPGVANYDVKFQPRKDSVSAAPLQVSRDLVLDHDNGWHVQHCENGIVKLTRTEGMTMTLDPSKLFASNIVPDPKTSLLNAVLKYWPRTFADLNCKDDLRTTICIVNDLMRQAKLCHDRESEVKVDNVKNMVSDLHRSCAAMGEWYRPLFPTIKFPKVANRMAEVDQGKLERFVPYIRLLIRQPPGSSS